MKLLIDTDYIAYKVCAAVEDETDYGHDVIVVTSNFTEVVKAFTKEINKIIENFSGGDPILFFSSSTNFRKKIDPEYKGHRNRKKPCGYKRLINWCGDNYEVQICPGIEADDALGIYATNPMEDELESVIVSPDKDMKQIPTLVWDMKSPFSEFISEKKANEWFFIQTMAGDATDGYSGVPGIGVKRAAELLEKEGATWATVVAAFEKAGLTEEDALKNARLARILRYSDYDHVNEQPILWTPEDASSASDGDDIGAAVQA